MAKAKDIVCAIIGVVHMIDGNRHSVATKADVIVDPCQVARIVVDIASTGSARRCRGVIPIAFNAIAVLEIDIHLGANRCFVYIVVNGIKLLPEVCCTIFDAVRCFQHNAGIAILIFVVIPILNDVGDFPGIASRSAHLAVVFNDGIIRGLVCPCDGLRIPVSRHLMCFDGQQADRAAETVQGKFGVYDNIRGCELRNIYIPQKTAHLTVGRIVTAIHCSMIIVFIIILRNELVFNILPI